MFNVMVDAKAQSAKLCAMDLGQEVGGDKSFQETLQIVDADLLFEFPLGSNVWEDVCIVCISSFKLLEIMHFYSVLLIDC